MPSGRLEALSDEDIAEFGIWRQQLPKSRDRGPFPSLARNNEIVSLGSKRAEVQPRRARAAPPRAALSWI